MEKRFNPGDLAVITYDSPGCEANIGRVVEILKASTSGLYGNRPAWCISPVTDDLYVVEYDQVNETRFRFMDLGETGVVHPEDWMMSVKTEDGTNSVETEQSENL